MGVGISYMGTKRELASAVADVIAQAQPGPMLDAFSGMCSVGEAVGNVRPIWTNDAQVFASLVGRAMFTSQIEPLRSQAAAELYHERFTRNFEALAAIYSDALSTELSLLEARSFDSFEVERLALTAKLSATFSPRRQSVCDLFTRQYADTYIGLRQAIEIDSLMAAAMALSKESDCRAQKDWTLIALGRAMLRVSNTTGHFAQFLKPKVSNYRTFQRQRRRSVWVEFLESADQIHPVGNHDWRSGNRSFNEDSICLLRRLRKQEELKPKVVYADPPYTNDQYSRYYHLFETLVNYDYPAMTGVGLYRPERFVTQFSLKSHSASALEKLVRFSAELGADIVLSYPTNGLVYEKGISPIDVIRHHYSRSEVRYSISHDHSTLGASKGDAKAPVTENIFLGRN